MRGRSRATSAMCARGKKTRSGTRAHRKYTNYVNAKTGNSACEWQKVKSAAAIAVIVRRLRSK
eukprot:4836882-Pleurochrysis_carterae.AAC.1